MYTRRKFIGTVAVSTALSAPFIAGAAYPPGVTDTEIKIGQTCAYSGPASAFGVIGRTYVACIRELNDNGGINGRRINFVSLDDSYSPPRTVELTRRLVEEDVVAFLYAGTGTACMLAVRPYLNEKAARERRAKRQTKIGGGGDCESIFPNARGAHPNSLTQPHERREMTGVRFERERV